MVLITPSSHEDLGTERFHHFGEQGWRLFLETSPDPTPAAAWSSYSGGPKAGSRETSAATQKTRPHCASCQPARHSSFNKCHGSWEVKPWHSN